MLGRSGGRHPRRGLRRVVPALGADRPDRQDGVAEAVRRAGDLRRHPAQGRHAELEGDHRHQHRPGGTDLRIQRSRRGRRRPQHRAQADLRWSASAKVRDGAAPRTTRRRYRSASSSSEPTDPADERIEVGVLVVGAGPAGLACAIRFGQLLADDPETAERLGEVPLADRREGQAAGLAPALRRRGQPPVAAARSSVTGSAWRTSPDYGPVPRRGGLHPHPEAGIAHPAPAPDAQSRQLHRLAVPARTLARRSGRGGRGHDPAGDGGRVVARLRRSGGRRPHRRQGPAQRREAVEKLRTRSGHRRRASRYWPRVRRGT